MPQVKLEKDKDYRFYIYMESEKNPPNSKKKISDLCSQEIGGVEGGIMKVVKRYTLPAIK